MLLRFTVANFASVRDEQELSAIAADRHDDIAVRAVPRTQHHVLPALGIFGPNASGKSNIVDALAFARSAVVNSHQRWRPNDPIPRRPFQLDPVREKEPSEFGIEFVAEGIRYQYGFVCDSEEFHEEWLYGYPEGRQRRLFERKRGTSIRFGQGLQGERKLIERLLRPNSLYLSAAAANGHAQLLPVYDWFAKHLRVAVEGNAHSRLQETRHLLEEHDAQAVLHLLRYADLGVGNVRFSDRKLQPEHAAKLADLLSVIEGEKISPSEISMGVDVEVTHLVGDREFELPMELESSGTQTWLALAGPVINALATGDVLVVDELDARLHHHLASQLVRLFQEPETNPNGAQLVFNSHDHSLLGHDTARLRRDQVWFTEKEDGATRCFPLTDYKVRSVENVEKRYLSGRYGAVPFFDEELLSAIAVEVSC